MVKILTEKIAIGIPTMGYMKIDTVKSLLGLLGVGGYESQIIFSSHTLVHEAREAMVHEARNINATHLFFLDSDMIVESDVIKKLLAHKKQIIGVNSHVKSLPIRSTVKFADENGKIVVGRVPDQLFSCHAVGTGIMLIDMKVFDVLENPWFFFGYKDGEFFGEDVWFCKNAAEKGIETWCDPTIKVGHIGDYIY